jgi:hypothetical protein
VGRCISFDELLYFLNEREINYTSSYPTNQRCWHDMYPWVSDTHPLTDGYRHMCEFLHTGYNYRRRWVAPTAIIASWHLLYSLQILPVAILGMTWRERERSPRRARVRESARTIQEEREGGWDGWQQLGTVLHTIIGGSSWHACWVTPSIMCVLVLVCAPGDGSSDLLYVLAVAQHLLLPLLESVISQVGYSTTPSICI